MQYKRLILKTNIDILKHLRTFQYVISRTKFLQECFSQVEDDFNPTENRETSEETHCASNDTQLVLKAVLRVPLDLIKRCSVKVHMVYLQTICLI